MAVDTLPNVALTLRSKTIHSGDNSNGDSIPGSVTVLHGGLMAKKFAILLQRMSPLLAQSRHRRALN
jgi:hypothetical protein